MSPGKRAEQERKEALREYISKQRHEQQAVEIIQELRRVGGPDGDRSAGQVGALKAALDGHLRLLNKYLPDLKSQEIEATVQASHEDMLAKLEGEG